MLNDTWDGDTRPQATGIPVVDGLQRTSVRVVEMKVAGKGEVDQRFSAAVIVEFEACRYRTGNRHRQIQKQPISYRQYRYIGNIVNSPTDDIRTRWYAYCYRKIEIPTPLAPP